MKETFDELMRRIDDEGRSTLLGIRGVNASLMLTNEERMIALKKIESILLEMLKEVRMLL